MQFLGYKKKKGSVKYRTDNIGNPTFFAHYVSRHNENLQEFMGRQPVFFITFKTTSFSSVASGGELWIKDIDTDKDYSFINQGIFNFAQGLENGNISLIDGQFRAMVKLVKKGRGFALEFATEEDDISFIDLELPLEIDD